MPSSSTRWTPLPENARVQALDAALESITTKLDAILSDSLKIPRPLTGDLPNFQLTLVNAYDRAVFNFADWAGGIASLVPGYDDRTVDPQLQEQVEKEAAAVVAEAKALMGDITKEDA
ncbi:hypothetical protein E8E12_006008 [Didymella heteroderae]|uniref:Uncharacterized protein n=1 Tax=Didymella heteroderae TaxID=1769908 RepID=A0A9P4WK83_9PLEO|nr:hypothetical protein E8E12_006008 [Didymella heteroderae]